tara:strand:- start:433 stop:657 length:225 start_codon:yes stop_codon:yes gene_type:complete
MVTKSSLNINSAASGVVLQGQGVGSLPNWSTATYPATAGTAGNVLTSDGTNWASTAPAAAAALDYKLSFLLGGM